MALTSVFQTVLCMSAVGGLIVLLLLPVRMGLKKAPKIYSYILWAAVLFRLLCPFAIPVSVRMPEAVPAEQEPAEIAEEAAQPETASAESFTVLSAPAQTTPYADPRETFAVDPAIPGTAVGEPIDTESAPEPEAVQTADPAETAERIRLDRGTVLRIGSFVWIAGAVTMLAWNTVSLIRLKQRMLGATPLSGEDGVYLADYVDTAFVWGFFRPIIILPSSLKGRARRYVIQHERAHIRRGDPVWRLLAFTALLVHWFNPLVWLAFRLSGKDMEMSCDEAVMRSSACDIRADYSETLLRFAAGDLHLGTALAFGEGETGSRVKNVMRYRKPALWVSLAAILVLVTSAAVFAVRPTARDTRLPNKRYQVSEEVLYEAADAADPGLTQVELAGDGTVSITRDTPEWITLGTAEDGTERARELFAPFGLGSVLEAQGVSLEEDAVWYVFNTSRGQVCLAEVRGDEVIWLRSLTDPTPKSGMFRTVSVSRPAFFERSLKGPVGRPVCVTAVFRKDEMKDYSLILFTAEQDETNVPGLALFERFDGDRAARLVCWTLADGVTAEGASGVAEMKLEGSVFTFELPDGTALSAEIDLPVKTKDFFGRVTSVSGGSIAFLNLPEPTAEAEADPDEKESVLSAEFEDYLREKAEADKARRRAEEEAARAEAIARTAAEEEAARQAAEEAARLAEEKAERAREERIFEEALLIRQAVSDAEEAARLEERIQEQENLRREMRELSPQIEREAMEYQAQEKELKQQRKELYGRLKACEEELASLDGQDPEKVLKLREKLEAKKAEIEASMALIDAQMAQVEIARKEANEKLDLYNEKLNSLNALSRELEAELDALRERLNGAEKQATSPLPADPSGTDSPDASAEDWGWNAADWGWNAATGEGFPDPADKPTETSDYEAAAEPAGDFGVLIGSLLEEAQAGAEFIDLADRVVTFPLPEGTDWKVESGYGWQEVYGMAYFHMGIDLYCPDAGTDVLAYTGGEVVTSGYQDTYGNYVLLDHGGNLATLYAHLEERFVEAGDTVETGQPIGTVGLTGSTHVNGLHFEVRCDGAARDPMGFLKGTY
ncbi:MAG: peptidoglycan DD-metalloendopeptidase family protein [Clostridia bacterium]|nr:peptidoglycan DD-metalloendopeptidase family protein [Clostridia bacterium]